MEQIFLDLRALKVKQQELFDKTQSIERETRAVKEQCHHVAQEVTQSKEELAQRIAERARLVYEVSDCPTAPFSAQATESDNAQDPWPSPSIVQPPPCSCLFQRGNSGVRNGCGMTGDCAGGL